MLTLKLSKCSRRVSDPIESVSCLSDCLPDVVWCNNDCRSMGKPRHDFECSWLKKYAKTIRHEHGEYDFSMLWLVVRILAERHLETQLTIAYERQRTPWMRGDQKLSDTAGVRSVDYDPTKSRSRRTRSDIGQRSLIPTWDTIRCYQNT